MNHIKQLFNNETNYEEFLNVITNSKMDIQIKEEEQDPFKFKIHESHEEIPEHLKSLNYQSEIKMTYNDIRKTLIPFFNSADSFDNAIIQQFKVYNHMIENIEDKNEQAKIYQREFTALKQLTNMLQLLYSRIYLIGHTLDFIEEGTEEILFSEVRRSYIYCINHKFKTINELNVFAQMFWSNCNSSMKKYYNFRFFQEELEYISGDQ